MSPFMIIKVKKVQVVEEPLIFNNSKVSIVQQIIIMAGSRAVVELSINMHVGIPAWVPGQEMLNPDKQYNNSSKLISWRIVLSIKRE